MDDEDALLDAAMAEFDAEEGAKGLGEDAMDAMLDEAFEEFEVEVGGETGSGGGSDGGEFFAPSSPVAHRAAALSPPLASSSAPAAAASAKAPRMPTAAPAHTSAHQAPDPKTTNWTDKRSLTFPHSSSHQGGRDAALDRQRAATMDARALARAERTSARRQGLRRPLERKSRIAEMAPAQAAELKRALVEQELSAQQALEAAASGTEAADAERDAFLHELNCLSAEVRPKKTVS